LPDILRVANDPLPGDKYRHWDRLRYLDPPDALTTEQWWLGIKLARGNQYRSTPLCDVRRAPFVYCLPDPVLARLHAIDYRMAGRAEAPDGGVTSANRDRYILNSLIDEAINSSQLEGASTTRQVAADMIREDKQPRDRDERMILNNFRAMQAIRAHRDQALSVEMILGLHRQLTEETLDNPEAIGRFQTAADERVVVTDNSTGEVGHDPPAAELLPERMEALVRFANGADEEEATFVHPLVRAIVLHFWLAHDHPFEDGNGRVARALFYWAMLRRDYWLFEFVSISHAIKEAPSRYARAFLETETDGRDLTYFLIHQLGATDRALKALDQYLARKAREVREVEQRLRCSWDLNHR
jgi:Fic family protein